MLSALKGAQLELISLQNHQFRFNAVEGLYYLYDTGVSFLLPDYHHVSLRADQALINMQYNFNAVQVDVNGTTISGPLFFNNNVDQQMAYITNTGIAHFNGLIVNGTNTLTVDNNGISVGGLAFSYFIIMH